MANLTPGQLAREAREKASLTREQLASSSGASVATIARFENDDQVPNFRTLTEISRVIPLDLSALSEAVMPSGPVPNAGSVF